MAKQNFLGLVKIVGVQSTAYNDLEKTGKLIFAHLWDSVSGDVKVNERFIINANGVEYKIATEDIFKSLEARVAALEAWKPDVDSSIDRLDSSVSALEAWKTIVDTSISNHETRIVALEEASTALGERIANVSQNVIDISTYVHTTVNASIDELQAKDVEIDASISDISSRLAGVAITAADNSIGVNNTSIALAGDNYVDLTAASNTVSASLKESALVKGTGTGSGDVSLATKGYVDEQVAVLEQALVFKGNIATTADASTILTDGVVEAGYTYVATGAGEYNGKKFENGDLVIVASDAAAGSVADIIIVERNLDGAVTAAAGLTDDYVILGSGAQTVKVSSLAISDLLTAIGNANSALQEVTASTSTGNYVTIEAAKNASTANVSVGVITATLADASAGNDGLATAMDVYTELTRVEEVTATSITTMADSLGLGSALNPNWSEGSQINEASTYREVIEELHGQVAGHVVNSFDGKTGAISIDKTAATDGSINFTTDGSTLKGTVVGWSGLVDRVSAAETSIGQVSTRLNETSTRLNDLSTYVHNTVDASIDALQAKDVEIDSSIDRLDASVSALENRTITGESEVLTNPNDDYVNVAATADAQGNVTIDSSVQLATDVTLPAGATHEAATGLATDGWVKDYLAWEVIE